MLKMKLAAPDANKHAENRKRTRANDTKGRVRNCNLCGVSFKAPSVHCCFCEDCKQHNELYRFHDWLPDELAVA